MIKIVTIGGGTGSPVVLKSLITAGFKDIKAISASTDSGGKTGIIRSDERDRVIAISDLLRTLLSLLPEKARLDKGINALYELFAYTDGRNRNLGYTIYYALLEKYEDDHLAVQRHIEDLLGTKFYGVAIPVTSNPANIKFKTASKDIYQGEHELDRLAMSKNIVKKIWLEPVVKATRDACKAIEQADFIIICPGSLYGSVLANFLPKGIKEAYSKSKAKKVLIANLVSDRNQTHKFCTDKYLKVFQKYTKQKKPFDFIITPNLTTLEFEERYPKVARRYRLEQSYFLGIDKSLSQKATDLGIEVLPADIFSLTEKLNRIRHDPHKLGAILSKILRH
jgi:uncharacterized cofD-like protein